VTKRIAHAFSIWTNIWILQKISYFAVIFTISLLRIPMFIPFVSKFYEPGPLKAMRAFENLEVSTLSENMQLFFSHISKQVAQSNRNFVALQQRRHDIRPKPHRTPHSEASGSKTARAELLLSREIETHYASDASSRTLHKKAGGIY
jgi:hypothetical protein